MKEFVADCADALTSKTACAECVLLHTSDLKAHNCSTRDIAGATALCSQVNSSSVTQ